MLEIGAMVLKHLNTDAAAYRIDLTLWRTARTREASATLSGVAWSRGSLGTATSATVIAQLEYYVQEHLNDFSEKYRSANRSANWP